MHLTIHINKIHVLGFMAAQGDSFESNEFV